MREAVKATAAIREVSVRPLLTLLCAFIGARAKGVLLDYFHIILGGFATAFEQDSVSKLKPKWATQSQSCLRVTGTGAERFLAIRGQVSSGSSAEMFSWHEKWAPSANKPCSELGHWCLSQKILKKRIKQKGGKTQLPLFSMVRSGHFSISKPEPPSPSRFRRSLPAASLHEVCLPFL